MSINISYKSKKLGRIPSINLLAGPTCIKDAPCNKGCYAKKGAFRYDKVIKSHYNNWMAYLENNEQYFKDIHKELNKGIMLYKYVRWHMSGDIVDMKYLYGVVELAKKNKRTKFLIFTKKFNLVNMYIAVNGDLPKNLIVLFSAWDKDFKVDNPYNLPVYYVNFKKKKNNPEIPANAKKCQGSCEDCLACWKLKKGQSAVVDQH